MEAIKCMHLTKQFKDRVAVNDCNITVQTGEIFALVGLNGAGKTTTIKMLSCLLTPTFGDAQLFGYSILTDAQQVKQIINLSPQETAIAPNLTVEENLQFIAQIYGFNKAHAQQKTNELLHLFGLADRRHDYAKKLSGGLQRRLGIALALVSEPKIIFLDEPTLGLDVVARRELWKLIGDLKKTTTVILTTHYLDEVEHLADHVAILKNGKTVAQGTVQDLLNQTNTTSFENAFLSINDKEELQ